MLASSIVLAATMVGCGVPNGELDRARVEARTCIALLRRADRSFTTVDPEHFTAVLQQFIDGGKPYSTLEPFLRACRSFG